MVTLADIEREVAARVGPYRRETASGGTATTAVVAALQSTIDLGDVADLYLLRRSASAGDRQRIVKDYTPATGTLTVDRTWSSAPAAGEVVELHHLDPAGELRPAVQAGLRRCFFVDRASVTLTEVATERDLTALLPWITDPTQVYEVMRQYVGAYYPPVVVHWWKAFTRGGHVWLRLWPDPYPNALYVDARRSAASWVKPVGEDEYSDSTTGPTDDDDEVEVSLDYAAAAGHIEAWRRCGPRLQPVAQTGLYPAQSVAAAVLTEMAAKQFHPPVRRTQMPEPFGMYEVQRP